MEGLPQSPAPARVSSGADLAIDAKCAKLHDIERQILELIVRSESLPVILTRIAELIEAGSPGLRCSVLLADSQAKTLSVGAAPSLPSDYCAACEGIEIREGAGACGTAAFRRAPVIIVDAMTDPLLEPCREAVRRFQVAACWSAPIFASDGRLLGTFASYPAEGRAPTAQEREQTELAASLASIAIERSKAAEARSRTESELEEAQRLAQLGSWSFDFQTRRLAWSKNQYRLFGVPFDTEVTPELALGGIHPNDREHIRQVFREAVADGNSTAAYEHRVVYPNGEVRYHQGRAEIIRDLKTQAIRLLGTTQDITDRKEAERMVRESEERYRTLFELSPYGVGIVCDDKLEFINPAGLAILGARYPGEIVGSHVDQWVMPESLVSERERFRRVVEFGELAPLRPQCYRQADGQPAEVEVKASSITWDGKPAAQLVIRDLTERKEAAAKIYESERQMSAVVGSASDAILAVDEHLAVTLFNPAAERMFGCGAEAALHSSLDRFILAPGKLLAGELARPRGGDLSKARIQWTGCRIDGTQFPIEVSVATAEIGGLQTLTFFVADSSERLRAEGARRDLEEQLRQAQKLESIGTLAGGLAHDFNNILGSIVGFGEIARQDAEGNPRLLDSIQAILNASLKARDIVRQMLLFSRPHQAEHAIHHLGPIMEDALGLLRAGLPSTIRIESRIGGDLPAVLADPTQIHQIVMNLATNGAHAMEPAGGVLRVELDQRMLDDPTQSSVLGIPFGNYVQLTVTDTGCGMEAATLERIFDPFFTTKPPGKGTGLGLAVVHGITRAHGGAIQVESHPGSGSIFRVWFPAHDSKFEAATPESAPTVPGNGERVLVVDDEVGLARVIADMLERIGYKATAVFDGESALDALADFAAYDVVLTDLTMPGINGLELARRARQRRPGLPFALITGFTGSVSAEQAAAAGISCIGSKPFHLDALGHLIRTALESEQRTGQESAG
jgi:PAS domain S-box-containing protein